MAVIHGKRINGKISRFIPISEGLLVWLDAERPDSYSGSGNDWLDLSGNNFHMKLQNSPSFTSSGTKYFSFNGSSQYGTCDGTVTNSTAATVANLGVGGTNGKTIVCVARTQATGGALGGLFDLGEFDLEGREFGIRRNNSTNNLWRAQFWGTADFDFTYSGNGVWTFYALVYGADKIPRVYGNSGTLLGERSGSFDLVTAGATPFNIARWTDSATPSASRYIAADIALCLVYNRGLSVAELQANYNIFKGRFGL